MSLFRRSAPLVRQWTGEPIIPPYPGATSGLGGSRSLGSPSSMQAMQSSAVWACVGLVARTVSMMPVESFRIVDGFRKPIPDVSLVKSPAPDTTMLDWVYMLVSALMLRGNAYGRILARDALLYPTSIELLPTDDVRVTVDANGYLVYKMNGVEIPRQDVWHVKAFRMAGLKVGLSPVQFAAWTINRDRAIQDFSLGYFLDAPHPSSTLTSDQAINQEQARTLKERLMASVYGREPLILGAGAKFMPISVSPEESQFLATQKYGVAEIARIYGVPPEKIAAEAGNSMTYANIESAGIDFLTFSIQWWLTLLESALSQVMPGTQHVRFNPSILLRTDIKSRYEATAIGIASHQLLPDEARAMGDLPPFTDEEKKEADLVPMTVSPSGRPLALPGSAPAGAAAVDPATAQPAVAA